MGWWCGVGEVVSAVEVDVFVGGGGEMGEVMVGGVCSGCFEVLEGGGGVDGVPGDYGVGEEGGATRLVRP